VDWLTLAVGITLGAFVCAVLIYLWLLHVFSKSWW
jgi:hypothetical protein